LISRQFADLTIQHYIYDLKRFFEHLQKNPIYATESDLHLIGSFITRLRVGSALDYSFHRMQKSRWNYSF